MIAAGIDIGAKFVKIVLLQDDQVLHRVKGVVRFDVNKSTASIFEDALKKCNLQQIDISRFQWVTKELAFPMRFMLEATAGSVNSLLTKLLLIYSLCKPGLCRHQGNLKTSSISKTEGKEIGYF